MAQGQPSAASMLDNMRDRLASLSDEARAIRSQMPFEYEPDVERIQQHMQRLGERLSDLSRGALVPYSSVQRVHERRVKEVRYVTDDDVRVGRTTPDQIIALGGPAGMQRRAQTQDSPWDDAAASALVQLYESGEAFSSRIRETAPAAPRASARAIAASRSPEKPAYGAGLGAMTSAAPQASQRGCTMDEANLDRRFGEIAMRIEEQLAQIRPDTAIASLGSRFDQLEQQITTIIGQMATRADVDELRIAETQIDEIAGQLQQLRRQMARLDLIDSHLGTLTSQLSDERLTRLFNEGVHVSADIGRLDAIDAQLRMVAVQLSDERLSGLVSRSASRHDDYEEVAHAAAQRVLAANIALAHGREEETRDSHGREIGEVRGLLESLINERRHNDENNASMLETMQQALIRVLDRIDSIEIAQQQPAPAAPQAEPMVQEWAAPAVPTERPARAAAPVQPVAPAYTDALPSYDDLIPATATVYAAMPAVEAEAGEASDFLPSSEQELIDADMEAYRQDMATELAPPRIPVYTTGTFDLDDAFSRSRDAEAPSFGEPQPEARPIEVLRHDFIADAHRAKLKAAAKPDMAVDSDLRAGELSVGAREEPAPRRRSIFSFRSQRVAMSLLILLAAIPAAIFFMPRTSVANIDLDTPAAITAPAQVAPAHSDVAPGAEPMDAAPIVPAVPKVVPPLNAPSKQTLQDGSSIEPRPAEFEDANVNGAQIDTASLPDGIMMQASLAGGPQLAQVSDQARMAYLSGQLGIAAAKATPASLMEQQLLRESGVAVDDAPGASGPAKLPPATVGPYSLRLAAAQGDASAQFEVASRLAEGKGTDQDLADAAQWYKRAAAQGFAMAQFRLGTLYERGLGVTADPQRAQIWYERAATQGNVKAMHNLAVLIASSPKADYAAAARWFRSASEYGLGDSQFNLAVLHENGMGVAKNEQEAYKWLILAAKSGDKDAASRRDAMKAKLADEQRINAEAEAETWQAKRITGIANDARLAGRAWQNGSARS